MRTRNIITILILCISNALYAQDSLLIGKWQLFEMQKDSVIIFNRDNVEIAIKEAINRQKSLDSAAIKNFKEITHPLMKKMFIEFLDNGNLNAGVLDLKEGKYVFKEKLGAYRIDGKKLGINLEGGIDSYIYSIENDILTSIPIIGGKVYQRGYAKYERIVSNNGGQIINETGLISFSCNRSFEQFLDLDSVLATIPDTLGFETAQDGGDTVDLRLNKAMGIQANAWGKFYKNPTITSIKKEDNSSFITIEFTGGGGYNFDGEIKIVEDDLIIYYVDISRKEDRVMKDTRYILTYEIRTDTIEGKKINIEYKKRLPNND